MKGNTIAQLNEMRELLAECAKPESEMGFDPTRGAVVAYPYQTFDSKGWHVMLQYADGGICGAEWLETTDTRAQAVREAKDIVDGPRWGVVTEDRARRIREALRSGDIPLAAKHINERK